MYLNEAQQLNLLDLNDTVCASLARVVRSHQDPSLRVDANLHSPLQGVQQETQLGTQAGTQTGTDSISSSSAPTVGENVAGAVPRAVSAASGCTTASSQPEDADRNLDFDHLVEKYQKKIFNVIYRRIGDYEEASDLTQETFFNAYKHYDRFRGDSKVFTWLYTIAGNLCINRIRQRERQRGMRLESLDQPRDLDEDEGMTREVADFTNSPQNVLEGKELRQRILAAVESLPPDYREVVILREFHGMAYNEIVAATGLSLENVKTRLSRAREKLRRKLEPYIKQ